MAKKKKKINSRAKGKRGELEAVKFLRSLGFIARRGQQYQGGSDSADVEVDELPHVHIEVKWGYPINKMDLGTKLFVSAWQQSLQESGDNEWCVLWKPSRKCWRLTWAGVRFQAPDGDINAYIVTQDHPIGIREALLRLEIIGKAKPMRPLDV